MSVSIQELGQRLKLLRKQLDLSQESLAESMGVNQNQISRLENGVGGTIELLLLLFSFYSNHFHVDLLFPTTSTSWRSTKSYPTATASTALPLKS